MENQQQRDRIFAEVLGPRIAQEIVNGLRFFAVDDGGNETPLPLDPTLVSDFSNDTPLYVSLQLEAPLIGVRRDRIKFVKIDTTIETNAGLQNIDTILPAGSKVIIHSGQMGYRTPHLAHDLFRQSRIFNDLSGTDGVLIFTPLSRQELRRPREEDKQYANELLKHLNELPGVLPPRDLVAYGRPAALHAARRLRRARQRRTQRRLGRREPPDRGSSATAW